MQRIFKIKDGVLYEMTEKKIEDHSKLLKFNMNLKMLDADIRRSRNDEHFRNFLQKAKELFTEDIENSKTQKTPVLGNHSIFYYMYGHMNDWLRFEEKQVIQNKAILSASKQLVETITCIRQSRDIKAANKALMDLLDIDEIGAEGITSLSLSQLTGIRADQQEVYVKELEKRFSAVTELAKYDK